MSTFLVSTYSPPTYTRIAVFSLQGSAVYAYVILKPGIAFDMDLEVRQIATGPMDVPTCSHEIS